jgi:hypothetical protein
MVDKFMLTLGGITTWDLPESLRLPWRELWLHGHSAEAVARQALSMDNG